MKRREVLQAAGAAWLAASQARGDEKAASCPTAAGPSDMPQVTWSRQVPVRYEADVAVIVAMQTMRPRGYITLSGRKV